MSDIRMCVRRQVTSGSQTPSILRRCRSMKYVVRQWLLINTSRTGIWGGGEGEERGTREAGAKSHDSKVNKATVWSPQGSDNILRVFLTREPWIGFGEEARLLEHAPRWSCVTAVVQAAGSPAARRQRSHI